MSKLILLRGNSGSGKSSTAVELQRRIGRNTLLISQDTVRREMLWAQDGCDTAALPLLIALLRYGYERCPAVILEGILVSAWYQPLFQTAAELFRGNIFAYYFDLPFEETMKRHSTREKQLEFGEREMRRWWVEKDFIGFLPEKTIRSEQSLDSIIEMILSDAQIEGTPSAEKTAPPA
ncbi:MAG: kinase [Lawsonibacter sp.]|nr:kinase [Lawsonibacter sp.]